MYKDVSCFMLMHYVFDQTSFLLQQFDPSNLSSVLVNSCYRYMYFELKTTVFRFGFAPQSYTITYFELALSWTILSFPLKVQLVLVTSKWNKEFILYLFIAVSHKQALIYCSFYLQRSVGIKVKFYWVFFFNSLGPYLVVITKKTLVGHIKGHEVWIIKGTDVLAFPRATLHLTESQVHVKAAKYKIQKPSTCHATLFHCKCWSMFRIFHPAWSTWTTTKTFVVGWRNAACWLVDFLGHEQICRVTSCEFDEKRATKPKFVAQSTCRPAFYFSQQFSSTHNKCFCCMTRWSRKVKNGKHWQKLATKQCCVTSWGFLCLIFCCLIQSNESRRYL